MTKDELNVYCKGELEKIDSWAGRIRTLAPEGQHSYSETELIAMSALLHFVATGLGNIIREILTFDGIRVPETPHPGQQLLKTAGELGIVPPELYQPVSALCAFRAAFLEVQPETLAWNSLEPLVRTLDAFCESFGNEIREYLTIVESD